jgi:FlaA1/EpsC-like NDP-sugar epimerase
MTTTQLPLRTAQEGLVLRALRAAAHMRSDLPLAMLDAALIIAAYAGVLLLRFDGVVPPKYWAGFARFIPVAIALHLLANCWAGLYGKVWFQASVDEARRVVRASMLAATATFSVFLLASRPVPASVVVLGAAMVPMLVGLLRFQSRLFAFRRHSGNDDRTAIVVIGAGNAGGTVIRDMLRDQSCGLVPVAVLDEDPRKHGRELAGVPILGGLDQLPAAVSHFGAEQALLAIPSADAETVRRVANAADAAGLSLKVLPSVAELIGGSVSVRDVRDVSIIDLLGRQQVETDLEAVRAILTGKRVLITGAGGSIGSEIARQVAACEPGVLLLMDHDETHLHDTSATITHPHQQVLCDIRERAHVERIFAEHRPEVVFHAAALKHVPVLESNPCEAVKTNVLGTDRLVAAAVKYGVERFVFISTDKAVNPANVMGASKRLGEQVLLTRAPEGSRFCAVRFGNVLGSRGSVIPTFVRQISEGGPVTITDERMTRYFMSIPEACQLVLQSAALSEGGEVFMLDMGEPVRIMDLAERMIRLSGRRVGVDVRIEITGMRPGEKLDEELQAPNEPAAPTSHPSIYQLQPPVPSRSVFSAGIETLARATVAREDNLVRAQLFDMAHRDVANDTLIEELRTLVGPQPASDARLAQHAS